MKATLLGLGALLLMTAAASMAQANPYPPYPYAYRPQAPDACGPGYFCTNYCGMVYGPNYCVLPPWGPWNGFRPCLNNQQQQQSPAGPAVHPFARSPRDYFMMDLNP